MKKLKRKKKIRINTMLLILIIVILIAILYYFLSTNISKQPQACINEVCFDVELAKTSYKRQQGLMHRQSLPLTQGMLFIFEDEDFHSFWMKNTLIPLDIIWINSQNQIVDIEHQAQPCKEDPCQYYKPSQPAKYALEINSGLSQKYDFNIGKIVTIIYK